MKLQTTFLALLGIVASKSFSYAVATDNGGELQILEVTQFCLTYKTSI